jgi:micrococcal nuclease
MPKPKKKKLSWKKVALAVGATAIIAGSVGVAKKIVNPGEKVVEVIDGDTFFIANRQRIRLLGVDAPELQYCFGKEAKDALTKKVLNKKVILKELKVDVYRRVMALVYADNEPINEFMVKNGFAIYEWDGGSESPSLKTANDFARKNNLGIFSPTCYQLNPPKPKCTIKGNIRDDDGVKTYLMSTCSHYYQTVVEKFRGEDWFCTEKEAKDAGFVKSSNCP